MPPPLIRFLESFIKSSFYQNMPSSVACTHIPKTHFGIGLVRIGSYGYEI